MVFYPPSARLWESDLSVAFIEVNAEFSGAVNASNSNPIPTLTFTNTPQDNSTVHNHYRVGVVPPEYLEYVHDVDENRYRIKTTWQGGKGLNSTRFLFSAGITVTSKFLN